MSGSPPQIETMGALHSRAAPRHSSSGRMSFSEVEYSRIRPQPVQVKLHVCNGSKLTELVAKGLVSEKDAEVVRQGPKDPAKTTIAPSRWMYWNVHLDGLERTHDLIVEREGVFKECILAIRMAKILGYQVATNTTVYKETDMVELEQLFDFLSDLGVDGHTITPGYEYDAAKRDMITRLNLQPENFFLTRKMTVEKS